jgi:hypothetical protein
MLLRREICFGLSGNRTPFLGSAAPQPSEICGLLMLRGVNQKAWQPVGPKVGADVVAGSFVLCWSGRGEWE